MQDQDRNQDQQRPSTTQSNPNQQQDQRGASNQSREDQNPQEGREWSNYRTREMGGEQEGGSGEGLASTPDE